MAIFLHPSFFEGFLTRSIIQSFAEGGSLDIHILFLNWYNKITMRKCLGGRMKL